MSFARAGGYSVVVAFVAFLILLTPAESARAQACCTATGSGEFGLVGPCHTAALSAQLSHQQMLGGYGSDGRFRFFRSAIVADSVLSLGGGVRLLDRRVELGTIVPLRLQVRRFADQGSTRIGIGDVFIGSRVTTLRDTTTGIKNDVPESYVPFLDIIVGLRLPTGRAPESSQDPFAADVTGSGDFESSLGAKVTKFLTLSHTISLSAIWGHRFARWIDGPDLSYRFAPGERLSVRASWLYIVDFRWSGGLFLAFTMAGVARRDGVAVEGSESHQLTAGGYVSWAFDFPDWELSASLTLDPFFPGAGRNISYTGPTLGLFLKRGFM